MSGTVRQAELSQGEVYRGLCFAVICCDRVSDIKSKRFASFSFFFSLSLSLSMFFCFLFFPPFPFFCPSFFLFFPFFFLPCVSFVSFFSPCFARFSFIFSFFYCFPLFFFSLSLFFLVFFFFLFFSPFFLSFFFSFLFFDSSNSESETKRPHTDHSTRDVVMLLDDSDVSHAVERCREVCRRKGTSLVDVNDWD